MASRWTDDRLDDFKHQVDDLGRRMEQGFAEQRREFNARFDRMEAQLEARFDKVDERFNRVDERFEKVDERFEKVDEKFDKVDERFETMDERFNRTQEMVIGLHATLTRFSLAFLVVVLGAVVARLA